MSRTIWKYPLQLIDWQQIRLPTGADLLSVGEQRGNLVLWAAVDPKPDPGTVRTIVIVGTGEEIPEGILRFIGTVQEQSGYVWHIFEG